MATGTSALVGSKAIESRPGWTLSSRRLVTVGTTLALFVTAANVLLAIGLRGWLGVPAGFQPLGIPSVASSSVVAMVAATLVFAWTARVRPDPRRAFAATATVALVLSWLPDLFILATGVFPHTTMAGVLSLMSLHVVAASGALVGLIRYGWVSAGRAF